MEKLAFFAERDGCYTYEAWCDDDEGLNRERVFRFWEASSKEGSALYCTIQGSSIEGSSVNFLVSDVDLNWRMRGCKWNKYYCKTGSGTERKSRGAGIQNSFLRYGWIWRWRSEGKRDCLLGKVSCKSRESHDVTVLTHNRNWGSFHCSEGTAM